MDRVLPAENIEVNSCLIVGDPFFLARHRPLAAALRKRLTVVEELPVSERALVPRVIFGARALVTGRLWPPRRATLGALRQRFNKEPSTFTRVSKRAEREIGEHEPSPAFVLQLFSMSSPATRQGRPPYAHYIDMTMAMVRREWPAWAPFDNEARYAAWIALEGATYRGAERVFTFSEATRRSVIADYGARPERVVAVGAAGHYDAVAAPERTYGNRSIVFNGSDFERKGGDRVLAAFQIVRERFPDATLTVVANADLVPNDGLHSPGNLSRTDLFALFDRTDVIFAPTRLDVLPGFVLEAMSRGCVPILSDAESMDEIVESGREGYVVSPSTPQHFAERIGALFADPSLLETLGTAARTRVLRDWNWDAVANAMVESLSERGAILSGERA